MTVLSRFMAAALVFALAPPAPTLPVSTAHATERTTPPPAAGSRPLPGLDVPRLLAQTGSDDQATDDEDPFALRRQQVPLLKANPRADKADAAKDDEEDENILTTWWFWTAAAVVVGGTVALGVLASGNDPKPARPCGAGFVTCFGDGRQ